MEGHEKPASIAYQKEFISCYLTYERRSFKKNQHSLSSSINDTHLFTSKNKELSTATKSHWQAVGSQKK
jgi:hypothetical protein